MNPTPIKSIAEIFAERRAKLGAPIQVTKVAELPKEVASTIEAQASDAVKEAKRLSSNLPANFIPNEMQKLAISYGLANPPISFCLTGPAGCGKSTTTAAIIEGLDSSPLLESTKFLRAGTPGVAIVSFTRQAVKNIRKMAPDYLKGNCLTIHALIEFTRDVISFWDPVAMEMKNKMIFVPQRTEKNKLPRSLHTLVIDEAPTVGTILYDQLLAALHPTTNIIFVGDIQQLTPPFDDSIFGYKLQQVPVVELNEVFRQALNSKILTLAHRILSGVPIPSKELKDAWSEHPDLKIKTWQQKVDWEKAVAAAGVHLVNCYKAGTYDPEEDMVLCPFNKKFGTLELNRIILNGCFPDREIHHVISGFENHYFAVGDQVMLKKEDYIITKINRNASYTGIQPITGMKIDRWGHGVQNADGSVATTSAGSLSPLEQITSGADEEEFEFDIDALVVGDDDRLTQASHVLHLQSVEFPTSAPITVSSAGDINSMLFSHALTVHKSQGSQWDRVFLLLHHSHNTMLSRELLYTGVTRAAKELIIFCEPGTFISGITSQRIPGKTAAEKAEFFKGKISPAAKLKAKKEAEARAARGGETSFDEGINW